jgi:hypothetical protein
MIYSRITHSILVAVLLTACTDQVVRLGQLNTGMTRKQVEDVQGKPDKVETSGNYTALRYGNDYYVIFENDRAIAMGSGTISRYPGTDRFFINESYP